MVEFVFFFHAFVILFSLYGIVRFMKAFWATGKYRYPIFVAVLVLVASSEWLALYGARLQSFFEQTSFVATFIPLIFFFGYSYLESSRRSERAEKVKVKGFFQKYVSERIINELMEHPDVKLGGEKQMVTVLFTDIRGFTSLSERVPPEELVKLLNEKYFDVVTNVLLKYDATVDKYIGDAVMAFFNAPIPQSDHALRAVKASVEIQKKLTEINAELARQGKEQVNVGIGINSGEAVVGNVGSHQFVDYTVIGDVPNTASRLNGVAKAGEIVVSEATYSLVKNHVEFMKEVEEVLLKGKAKPVKVYKVKY
ncbi:adenylate/guanylate cyclase domain-containing protein [Candidatus Micrarchaeota archaeon]|nr:adenylate/guanylate cyclase domain-containing protein [Candidatus Micrarchaeota archaeon]